MAHEAMDIETVAELLGVSTRQVRTYVANGLPCRKEGRTPVFAWRETLDWYIGYRIALESGDRPSPPDDDETEDEAAAGTPNEDIRQATLRKTRAEADLKQLALSRQRSEVITIADAKQRLDRLMGNLRAKLLSLPPKLASRLEGLKARTDREAALKDEIEALCREISTGAVVDVQNQPEMETTPQVVAAIEASADAPALSNLDLLRNLADLLQEYD